MKNSLIILATSLIALWSLGFQKDEKIVISTKVPVVYEDTLKNKIDSLELYRSKILQEYATEIQMSYETVKNEKEKQEELNLSASEILNLVDSVDTINNNYNITKK